MTKREIADLIVEHKLLVTVLVDALRWLDENEARLDLKKPMNQRAFLRDLADKLEIADES